MKDELDNNKKISKAGLVVLLVVLALVGASLVLLFQPRKRVEEAKVTVRARTNVGRAAEVEELRQPTARVVFTAEPWVVEPGKQPVELRWDILGAERVRVEGLPGSFAASGRYILEANHALLTRSGSDEGARFTLTAMMADGGTRELKTGVIFASKLLEEVGRNDGR